MSGGRRLSAKDASSRWEDHENEENIAGSSHRGVSLIESGGSVTVCQGEPMLCWVKESSRPVFRLEVRGRDSITKRIDRSRFQNGCIRPAQQCALSYQGSMVWMLPSAS